jgi:hypothetical protein
MIRFEILLPLLFYNDGRPVEREKFLQTEELVQRFSATSTDTIVVGGRWLYQSTLYSDQLLRVRTDVEDTPENWQAMRDLKEIWKARFEQLDIWITVHRIEVI